MLSQEMLFGQSGKEGEEVLEREKVRGTGRNLVSEVCPRAQTYKSIPPSTVQLDAAPKPAISRWADAQPSRPRQTTPHKPEILMIRNFFQPVIRNFLYFISSFRWLLIILVFLSNIFFSLSLNRIIKIIIIILYSNN